VWKLSPHRETTSEQQDPETAINNDDNLDFTRSEHICQKLGDIKLLEERERQQACK